MTECLTPDQIACYRNGAVDSVEELLAIDQHLASCVRCRDALRSAASAAVVSLAQKLTPVAGESACLDDDLMARYVDGEADVSDAEIVETHIADCVRCASDVASLRTFRAQMQTCDWTAARAAASSEPWWKRLGVWIVPSQPRGFALQLGGAAAVAAVAALIVFWTGVRPLQEQVADLRMQLSQMQETNDALLKQVSAIADLQNRLAGLQQENEKMRQDYQTARATVATLQTRLARLEQSRTPNPKSQTPNPKSQIPNPKPQTPAPSPLILLALNDGSGRVTLDKQGNLAGLESLPSTLRQEVKVALKTQQVKKAPLLAGLTGGAGVLRSGSGDNVPFALVSPVGTAVLAKRLTFRWKPLSGASRYTVTVVDDVNHSEVAISEPLSGTEWTMPQPLPRGRTYRWYVTALKDGAEVQSPGRGGAVAKFKVLEQKQTDDLERAKRTCATSHLTLGLLYTQKGLLDDAEREFQALLEQNPKSSIARKLLDSVKALRRM